MLYLAELFAPDLQPAGLNTGTLAKPSKQLNRFEDYKPRTAIPVHRLSFNSFVGLPAGKGKRFQGNSNRLEDALLGGYQISSLGNLVSQSFQPAAGNWGPLSNLEVYKSAVPITDCRSGVCRPYA